MLFKCLHKIIIPAFVFISCLFSVIAFSETKQSGVKVTFIDFGAGDCPPCKAMKEVQTQVREKYGDQVDVKFYDIRPNKDKAFADYYKIQIIPTQVFLDSNYKEYHRHTGYYPFDEVEKVLKQGGVR